MLEEEATVAAAALFENLALWIMQDYLTGDAEGPILRERKVIKLLKAARHISSAP